MKTRPIIFTAESVRAILEGRKTQTRRVVKPQPFIDDTDFVKYECPFGRIGGQLWVREKWIPRSGVPLYYADYPSEESVGIAAMYSETGRWKTPLFMPRVASRITLKIVNIRVERLWDITDEDVRAEGYEHPNDFLNAWEKLNGKHGYHWESSPWVWVIEFERKDTNG